MKAVAGTNCILAPACKRETEEARNSTLSITRKGNFECCGMPNRGNVPAGAQARYLEAATVAHQKTACGHEGNEVTHHMYTSTEKSVIRAAQRQLQKHQKLAVEIREGENEQQSGSGQHEERRETAKARSPNFSDTLKSFSSCSGVEKKIRLEPGSQQKEKMNRAERERLLAEDQAARDQRWTRESERLTQLIKSKLIEEGNDEMPDNKESEIPLELPDLINLAIWHEVIDEKERRDLWEFVNPHNRTILSDGSVHYSWAKQKKSAQRSGDVYRK